MSPARRIVVYSLIRLVLFAIPFGVLMFLRINWWISAPAAAIVAACLSYLLLRPQRDAVASTVYDWRHGDHHDADNDIENDAIDRSEQGKARP